MSIVADLREPAHPGMDLRRLVARLDGEERRRERIEGFEKLPHGRAGVSQELDQDSRAQSRRRPNPLRVELVEIGH